MRDRQMGTTHSGTDRSIPNVLLPVVIAFALLCVLAWLDELVDLPHFLLGSPGTPLNWQEAILETALILIAAVFIISRLLRDNHARDLSEQSLRALSSRYQAILAAVPDIIMEVDRDEVCTWANQAGLEFFGEDVLGKEAAGYFEGEGDTYDVVQPFLEGREDVIYVESWQRRQDGETRLLAWWCRALKDADGNLMGALSTARDVTERLRAQQALQQAHDQLEQRVKEHTAQLEALSEELNDFAYVVSHDLKAPLRAINQLAAWILADYGEALDQEGREMMRLLAGRTKRMHNLMDGILQYSTMGRVPERAGEVDINRMVQEMVEMLASPEHIQVMVEDELPTVMGRPTQLRQVFQNLIGNAIRFVDKPEGWIRIGCVDEGIHWQFSVADNGPGIDEKYHTKIFQPFQTLSRRDDVESTGIGLALVKRAVASWGGDVWVASSVGLGSTFYFTLPKKEEDDEVR